jgi:hypothetical protein
MKCPACGFEQEGGQECLKCGIVFEKFLKIQEEKRKKDEEERRFEREQREGLLAQRREIFKAVSKDKVHVSIQTIRNRIEGYIYVTKNFRITDMLNSPDIGFIAITDAKIYSLQSGVLVDETEFVSINKNHIIMVTEKA